MPKEERKLILSRQPLALHEVSKTGWKHQKIETFGALEILDALKIILQKVLLADAEMLQKMDVLDDQEFSKNPHRKRRYISREQNLLYLQKDEAFAKKHSTQIYGYWFPTNIGFKELSAIFKLACEAAGIDNQIRQGLKAIRDI